MCTRKYGELCTIPCSMYVLNIMVIGDGINIHMMFIFTVFVTLIMCSYVLYYTCTLTSTLYIPCIFDKHSEAKPPAGLCVSSPCEINPTSSKWLMADVTHSTRLTRSTHIQQYGMVLYVVLV